MNFLRKIAFNLLLLFSTLPVLQSYGQFYNGHQMSFGKNRVQYREFVWQFYRFKKFDVYFYEGGNELAQYVARYSINKVDEFENYFEYGLNRRIIFVVFNNLSDFRQSNLGLDSEGEQYNIGGTTKIIENKVFIYFDGDHKKLEQQISAAIVEVIVNEYLVGDDLKSRVANSTLLTYPDWYIKGLTSYLSAEWNFEIENRVKDGILSGKYENFNYLTGDDAMYAGHSIWHYIVQKYGKSVIPNILYLTRVSKNADSGFLYVLGTPLKYLSYDWLHYFDSKYYNDDLKQSLPNGDKIIKKPKKSRVYDNVCMSPDGKYIAYTSNDIGQYRIWLYDTETKENRRILKKEQKLDQITDYSYPQTAWHPSGKLFTWIIEEKGSIYLFLYDMETRKTEKREIIFFDKVLSYKYSPDGYKMVMSATKRGQSDLFIYNVVANSVENITNDVADDLDPCFINGSDDILFISDRLNDTLPADKKSICLTGRTTDVFIYNLKSKSTVLKRITKTPYIAEYLPFQYKNNVFGYISDENGTGNRFIATYDSTIAFIDTSTHYAYFTISHPVTNYKRSILNQDYNASTGMYTEIVFYNDRFNMHTAKLNAADNSYEGKYFLSPFRKKFNHDNAIRDSVSINKAAKEQTENFYSTVLQPDLTPDTIIDVNNYIFDREKYTGTHSNTALNSASDSSAAEAFLLPKQRYYFTSFYTNYLVSQVDFSFINRSYQAYTGGPVFFNPGFNLLMKVNTYDLMEDYKITGAFRVAGNLNSTEYLLSFENLKKQVDKQFILHRQAFIDYYDVHSVIKTQANQALYIMRYPFNQVSRIGLTGNIRYDKNVPQSGFTINDLERDATYKVWAGVKAEYVFDNTRFLGSNLYYGTRYKFFAEAFKQVNKKKSDLYVVGIDFRHYQKLHRSLIWASRFAASSSFGSNLLLYYLGSETNWINLSTKIEMFDPSVKPNPDKNWAFQTLASDMRGFTQNIRNGNSFVLMNQELRWPVIKYFSRRPINSDFLNSFQIVGFFDVGSAWTGKSPTSDENSYNTEVYENGPITVIIDNEKSPFVYGFGTGLRSRLLGYFVRADWAWGVDSGVILPRIFYLSLSLDF